MRYLYVKYQNPIPYGSKDIAQVKDFSKLGQSSRSRSQGQKSWYQKKGLIMRYLYLKYQNPILYGLKDIAQVKVFFKTRSKFKIKVTRSKLLVPKERSLHEVSICEISEPYPLWF
jgi:hypothetical protein